MTFNTAKNVSQNLIKLNMSRSNHTTLSDLRGFTNHELKVMTTDPDSILHQWANKNILKKKVKTKRVEEKQSNKNKL